MVGQGLAPGTDYAFSRIKHALDHIALNLCRIGQSQAILLPVKSFRILDDYISAALETAKYETIDKGAKVYAEVPAFRGAWADGKTRAEAKRELRQVLKGWIELQLERGKPLPALRGARKPQLALA